MIKNVVDKLMSGRYSMLITFGFTLCLMCIVSLSAIIMTHNDKKIEILTAVLNTLIGFVAGSFNRMWDNYNYKPEPKPSEMKKERETNETNEANEKTSVVSGDVIVK